MKRWIAACFFGALLLLPLLAQAKSFYSDGKVDNSNGTSNASLRFRDFEITPEGFITGYILNISNNSLKGVEIDMWTANKAETRIFWRKRLNIGDLVPNGRYQVREPYSPMPDDLSEVIFKFRLPATANFRNSKIKD